MNFKNIFLVTLLGLFTLSCSSVNKEGNGNVVTEIRNVTEYSELMVSGAFHVEIVEGAPGKIEIQADENLMQDIDVKVINERLQIKLKNDLWINGFKKLYVKVPARSLDAVVLSGSGLVQSNFQMQSSDPTITLSGSGKIDLALNADHAKIVSSGSGKVLVTGTTQSLNTTLSGSGNIDASGFRALYVQSVVSGSGRTKVHAEDKIKATISGSGVVIYRGNPNDIEEKVSGSGKVRRM